MISVDSRINKLDNCQIIVHGDGSILFKGQPKGKHCIIYLVTKASKNKINYIMTKYKSLVK